MLSAGSRIQILVCLNMSSLTGLVLRFSVTRCLPPLMWLALNFQNNVFQTGEGVKDARKGICANHVSAMANFLKVILHY